MPHREEKNDNYMKKEKESTGKRIKITISSSLPYHLISTSSEAKYLSINTTPPGAPACASVSIDFGLRLTATVIAPGVERPDLYK